MPPHPHPLGPVGNLGAKEGGPEAWLGAPLRRPAQGVGLRFRLGVQAAKRPLQCLVWRQAVRDGTSFHKHELEGVNKNQVELNLAH